MWHKSGIKVLEAKRLSCMELSLRCQDYNNDINWTDFKMNWFPTVATGLQTSPWSHSGKILAQLPTLHHSIYNLQSSRHRAMVQDWFCGCRSVKCLIETVHFSSEDNWNWRPTGWKPSSCRFWQLHQAPLAKQVRIQQLQCLNGMCTVPGLT